MLHETVWTHLVAAVFTFSYARWSLDSLQLSGYLRFSFIVFECCILCCFGFSTIFHTFCAISPRWYHRLIRLDFIGIALVIGGSYIPPLNFAFKDCLPTEGLVYTVVVSVLTVAAAILIAAVPGERHSEYKCLRIVVFMSLALFGVIPLTHGFFVFGSKEDLLISFSLRVFVMYLLFGTSVVFYATRIPERLFPKVFDVVGHSHQWFHVFSFLGIFYHFQTCLTYAQADWGKACRVASLP